MSRKDGKRVKNLDGMHNLMNYIMPLRTDADVYINTKIDVTNLVKYIEKKKKKEEYKDLTYFHAFCTAIGKLIYNRPLLNRFVINKKFYDRNDVSISFVAKKEFNDTSEELMTVVKVDKNDNIFSLSNKISGRVKNVRSSKMNYTDKIVDTIGKMPGFIKWIAMKIVKFADNHGLIPESWTKDLIYYSTVLVSNLGSIDCGAIYHHLTDLGTNSILITIGKIKDEPVVIDGKIEIRKMCEFGVNLDERIADGFYFTKSLKLLEYVLDNPELLEEDADVRINSEKNK